EPGEAAQVRQAHVLQDGLHQHQPQALAVLRDQADAVRHRVTGAPYRDLLAIELDPALDHASVLAEQGGDELGAPRAHEAGDAQDLSLSQVEAHALEHFPARIGRVHGVEVLYLEEDLARLPVAFRESLLHLATHHQTHELLQGEVLGGPGGHELPIPQDRHGIGDAKELLQLVGDVDAGDPLGLELSEDLHELVDLGCRQGGRRLVEYQDPGVLGERLGDLGHLHLADAEIRDDVERRDLELVSLQQAGGIGVQLVPVDRATSARLLAQVDVLADGHLGDQGQLLVDGGDSFLDGLPDGARAQSEHLAVVDDVSLVRSVRVHAAEDLHERGLAGAVLPAQPVDLTPLDLDGHVAERGHTRELLRHSGDLEESVLWHFHFLRKARPQGPGPPCFTATRCYLAGG